jgi:hypothetical protein
MTARSTHDPWPPPNNAEVGGPRARALASDRTQRNGVKNAGGRSLEHRAARGEHQRRLSRIAALLALAAASCAIDRRDLSLESQSLTPDATVSAEGPTCSAGSVLTCWEAADGSSLGAQPEQLLGECRLGTRACGEDGVWGACTGAVSPSAADLCDIAGSDNDCDGVPNEGCPCGAGESRSCGTTTGNCEPGTQVCVDGTWGACEGGIAASTIDSCAVEQDDANCNGVPNEGCACLAGQSEPCGDCGLRRCDPQTRDWGECVGQEQTRECWETPEGSAVTPERPITVSGNCRFGSQACGADGAWAGCDGAVGPQARDRCDVGGDDADCNGIPNDGCDCLDGDVRACGTDTGNCQQGTQACAAQVWGACDGEIARQQFDSCATTGDDADCDGSANSGCLCIGSQTRPCNDCGTQTCNPNARTFDQCVGDPSLTQCVGNILTTCNASGSFVTTACPFGCQRGGAACAASCPPGQKPCNNSCVPNAQCCGGCSGNTPVCENGACVARRNGEGCSVSNECASGICRDGFCCNSACTGQCESCASATNRGTCVAVTAPRFACEGSGICGGRCDGFNRASCVYPGSTTSCGVPSCTGDSVTTQVCGGSGTCTTSLQSCQFGCRVGNNSCAACRQKNSNNLLFNPGLDGSRDGWNVPGGVNGYSAADVEGCNASGSIVMTDFTNELSQCQNITAGVGYLFGFRFRGQTPNQGNTGYCDLSFYPGLDCTGEAIFVDDAVPAQVASQGFSWGEASGSATAPGNVRSARMTCIAAIGFGNYDQLYLSRTTVGF